MSNHNTDTLSSSSRKSSGSIMRVTRIGKVSPPVNLSKMSSVNNNSWKKSANFETIRRSVYSLKISHTVADFIALVSGEIPQDTGVAFHEAQSSAQVIVDKAILIDNLEPVTFLTSTGNVAIIDDVTDLKSRSEDITFLRFNCVVNSSVIDYRATIFKPFSFQFCLKLPQYIYDIGKCTATPVAKATSLPVINPVSASLSNLFQANDTPPSTPINQSIGTTTISSTGGFSSPAMKLFLASTNKSNTYLKNAIGI